MILFILPGVIEPDDPSIGQRMKAIDPQHQNIQVRISDSVPDALAGRLKASACDLLMVSASSELLKGRSMKQCLNSLPYPVVVVS